MKAASWGGILIVRMAGTVFLGFVTRSGAGRIQNPVNTPTHDTIAAVRFSDVERFVRLIDQAGRRLATGHIDLSQPNTDRDFQFLIRSDGGEWLIRHAVPETFGKRFRDAHVGFRYRRL